MKFTITRHYNFVLIYNVTGKLGKVKRQKLIKKGKKEQHLPDSCSQTATEHKQSRKTRTSASNVAFISRLTAFQ